MAQSLNICTDARCIYAFSEECDCKICNGAGHGGGMGLPKWDEKVKKLSKTRKAFRKMLNEKEAGSGRKLYRKNRLEFENQYQAWIQ